MKTIFNTTKRKRIRTRKSLNEIRNRSRRFINSEAKPTRIIDDMGNNQRKNHLVTSNRLTLEMFPNAVRSETVTRFDNDEVKKKFYLNFKDVIHLNKRNNCTKHLSVVNEESRNSDNSIQSISDEVDLNHNTDKNIKCAELQSPEVISGIQREAYSLQPMLHSSLTSAPSRAHHTHEKYYLYEEFMSEISVYIKQTVAKSLLSDDIIERLKRHLFTMRLQSMESVVTLKHKPTMSLMSDIHVSDETEVVVEDPMDYIRFSYSTMQNTPNYQSQCNTNDSDSESGSMLDIHSPHPMLSSSSRTGLSDTPEYIYFPHKLN